MENTFIVWAFIISAAFMLAFTIYLFMRFLRDKQMVKKSYILDLLFDNMAISLFRIDGEGIIRENILPQRSMFTDHIAIGKSIFDYYPEWIDMVKRARAGDRQTATTFNKSNGKKWYHENYLFSGLDQQVTGFIIDVTDKVLDNSKILESEEKFRRLIESAPDAMVLVNGQGDIELVNTQTEKIFGYSPGELLGRKIESLIPDRFTAQHFAHRSQFHEQPKTRSMGSGQQLSGKRKDGSEFAVEISLSPIKTHQGLLVSASIRDVSARKEVELELQKARIAAENANNFKSRFLANMSHEIRTPLNAIIGFANVLQSDNLTNDLRKEYLNHISTSGTLLLKLIGDILDLSKIEEGKSELTNEVFILKDVITSGILPYKFRANEKGLELLLEYDDEIPQYVYGDQYKIKQLIINLIGNSIKFTKEGKIAVRVSRHSTINTNGFVDLQFSVSDTGIGVPPEKQQSVFESFTQADNSIAREFGGSGLGLSIVNEMVKLMGGSVYITSPSNTEGVGGPGATITFNLRLLIATPLAKDVAPLEEDIDLQFHGRGVRILVVEDNLVNQRLAKVLLERSGCGLDFASNGKEAIDKIKANQYSLVLMDVQMPIMDGYEATKFIRANIDPSIPIVGLTANVFSEDVERYRQAGMDDFLGKPYGQAQLYRIVNKWVKKV